MMYMSIKPAYIFEAATCLAEHKDIECRNGVWGYSPFFSLYPEKRLWLLSYGWSLQSLLPSVEKAACSINRESTSQQVAALNSCLLLHQSASATDKDALQAITYRIAYEGMYDPESIKHMLKVSIEPIYLSKQRDKQITLLKSMIKTFVNSANRCHNEHGFGHLPQELNHLIAGILIKISGLQITVGELFKTTLNTDAIQQTPIALLPGVKAADTIEEHTDALVSAVSPSKEAFSAMRY